MHGYSDRVSHALAFTAKYHGTEARTAGRMAFLMHPANVAVILVRYGADQTTVVAGIVHHLLEEASARRREELEHKIAEKFGGGVLAVARDAIEPKYDGRGDERPWRVCKQDYLAHLAIAEPRALDICVADELQICGATIASLRRLGVEYLRTLSHASSEQMVWWYRSMIEVLDGRADWPRGEMLAELRLMSTELVRGLRRNEEDL